ncbi:diacylglycerol kinase [Microbacterium sediminicola]|uniref:Diacylglycerol kinase n=1 Tax=Microbacterium sediminicola TaxID=415210 RepID=A0ABP4TK95_9MICO
MDITVLVNPSARGGTAGGFADRAIARLAERGLALSVIHETDATSSRSRLRTALAGGVDGLVVVGGDGTVALALQELAGTDIPLGIIPAGTGNDIAAALGIPEQDPERAVDLVVDARTRAVDLARITRPDGTSTVFCSVLATGFDSRVNDRANRMTWPRGAARYQIAILQELARLRTSRYRVTWQDADGEGHERVQDLLMASVANGPTYGGGIPICPPADPADGLLDLFLVRSVGRMRFLRLLPRVNRGTHLGQPEIELHRARSVTVAAADISAYADGEPVGALPLTVDVLPRALRAFAPV